MQNVSCFGGVCYVESVLSALPDVVTRHQIDPTEEEEEEAKKKKMQNKIEQQRESSRHS